MKSLSNIIENPLKSVDETDAFSEETDTKQEDDEDETADYLLELEQHFEGCYTVTIVDNQT